MTEYLVTLLAAALVNGVYLAKSRGKRTLPEEIRSSVTLGMGVIFVMTASSAVCGILDAGLEAVGASGMRIVLFLLVIGGFVWLNLWTVKNYIPDLWPELEAYLPLLAGNCAVLGVAADNARSGRDVAGSVLTGFGTGVLLTVLMVIFDGIRSRIVEEDLPEAVRGGPVVALCAALLSLALMGLTGLSF